MTLSKLWPFGLLNLFHEHSAPEGLWRMASREKCPFSLCRLQAGGTCTDRALTWRRSLLPFQGCWLRDSSNLPPNSHQVPLQLPVRWLSGLLDWDFHGGPRGQRIRVLLTTAFLKNGGWQQFRNHLGLAQGAMLGQKSFDVAALPP